MNDDRLNDEMMAAVARLQAGERAAARADLLALWSRSEAAPDPYVRSALAHFIADTQDDPEIELEWDLKALAAAVVDSDAEDFAPASPALAAFLPSLHLNVGDAFRRTGDLRQARRHADAGGRAAVALDDDGYGRMIRAGLDRLHASLGAGPG